MPCSEEGIFTGLPLLSYPVMIVQCAVVGGVVGIIDLHRVHQTDALVDFAVHVRLIGDIHKVVDARNRRRGAAVFADDAGGVSHHYVDDGSCDSGGGRGRLILLRVRRRRRGARGRTAARKRARIGGRAHRDGRSGTTDAVARSPQQRNFTVPRYQPQGITVRLRDATEHRVLAEGDHRRLFAMRGRDLADPGPGAIGMQDVPDVTQVDPAARPVRQPHAALEHRIHRQAFIDLHLPDLLRSSCERLRRALEHEQGRSAGRGSARGGIGSRCGKRDTGQHEQRSDERTLQHERNTGTNDGMSLYHSPRRRARDRTHAPSVKGGPVVHSVTILALHEHEYRLSPRRPAALATESRARRAGESQSLRAICPRKHGQRGHTPIRPAVRLLGALSGEILAAGLGILRHPRQRRA